MCGVITLQLPQWAALYRLAYVRTRVHLRTGVNAKGQPITVAERTRHVLGRSAPLVVAAAVLPHRCPAHTHAHAHNPAHTQQTYP